MKKRLIKVRRATGLKRLLRLCRQSASLIHTCCCEYVLTASTLCRSFQVIKTGVHSTDINVELTLYQPVLGVGTRLHLEKFSKLHFISFPFSAVFIFCYKARKSEILEVKASHFFKIHSAGNFPREILSWPQTRHSIFYVDCTFCCFQGGWVEGDKNKF